MVPGVNIVILTDLGVNVPGNLVFADPGVNIVNITPGTMKIVEIADLGADNLAERLRIDVQGSRPAMAAKQV